MTILMRVRCLFVPLSRVLCPYLVLLVLCTLGGCAVEPGPVYTKDGKAYGSTTSTFWRNTWWQNYERGLSYAEGEFWDEAVASFQAALATRLGQRDQRRANTYGLHFLAHYFPHRELGIVYYRLGRYQEALHELMTSLNHSESAKAKFYLNKVRQALCKQSECDAAPPRIMLAAPTDDLLTNRFTVMAVGHVEDDTYVSTIAINGRMLHHELAEPRLAFAEEVVLYDGPNTIEIVAEDLSGKRTSRHLTVHLDRHGPLLSLEGVAFLRTPLYHSVRVHGMVSDQSRITRFVLAGQQVPLLAATASAFQQETPVPADTTLLPFEVEDAAGNVTRGDIELIPPTSDTPKTRHGTPVPLGLPRWASLHQSSVVADLTALPANSRLVAQLQDRDPPRITFTGLEDREVVYDNKIYLEGRVTDASAITAFSIAGESYWKHKCQQLFFGYFARLRAGQMNGFLLEAADEWGNRGERAVRVLHQIQQTRQLGARLRVLLAPFARSGQPSVLVETVAASLFDAMVGHKRFDILTRDLTLRQEEFHDPAAAARAAKAMGAEGILIGTVIETTKQRALDVYARFVDVDTETVLATEDVYSEDLTPLGVKALMSGLAVKLHRHFPLQEGVIVAREGQKLWVNLSGQQGTQPGTRLLVFREEKTLVHSGRVLQKPERLLAEARIMAVSPDLSEARLLPSVLAEEVQESDKVITK